MQENRLDSVKKEFSNYLSSLGLSPKSYKNYRSDLNHFLGWAILKVRSFGSYVESLTDVIPFLSSDFSRNYKTYMQENLTPRKTVNRRLSTLRHLSRFLIGSQSVDLNFMEGIENIGPDQFKRKNLNPLINNFKAYLEAENVSASTVKNYLSDVKQFLSWLEANKKTTNQSSN